VGCGRGRLAGAALEYAAAPCKGAAGPVTRIRPRPAALADPGGPGDAAAGADLDSPRGVAELLDSLRRADAGKQVAVLLARNPAAAVSLGDPVGVAELLDSMRLAGAGDQAAVLADRAAAVAGLDDLWDAADLDGMRLAGPREQAAELVGRAGASASLDDPSGVAEPLDGLRRADAGES
jgi:hypothetical protein